MQRLRFKADDGSSFPDWKEKKLGNCTEFVKDGTHGTHKNVSNGHPLLSAKDIFDNVVHIPNDSRLISDDDYNKIFSKYNLQIGDVLITIVGTIGRTALVTDGCKHVAFQRSVGIIRPDKNIIDSEYLKIVCDVPHFQNELEVKKNKGAQAGVYLGVLSNIEIPVPSLPEQQKIAEFLSTIDTVIEKQKETVSAWEERKKGVMQKLFSQEVRFKADDGSDFPEWEEKNVEDVCSVSTGKGNTQDKVDTGVYRFYVRSPIIEHSDSYLFDEEAVITVGDGVGTGKVFHYVKGKYNLHQRCYRMYDFRGVTGKYFYYFFSTNFYRRVKSMSAKTSVDSVRMEMITKMKISVPCLAEQQKIADCLLSLDEVIEKQKSTLTAWEERKKGLLQQMFI